MTSLERKREAARKSKRTQRAYWKSKGWRRMSEVWVHPADLVAIARYVDKKNRERAPEERRRPPSLVRLRPRGGVTVHEAARRLNRCADVILIWLRRGRLDLLQRVGLIRYLTEASVRREETALSGLDTSAAAKYLTARGHPIMPKTLINWRLKRIGPRYLSTSTRVVRYSWVELDLWLKQKRKEKS